MMAMAIHSAESPKLSVRNKLSCERHLSCEYRFEFSVLSFANLIMADECTVSLLPPAGLAVMYHDGIMSSGDSTNGR